jgi:hypothetical protein
LILLYSAIQPESLYHDFILLLNIVLFCGQGVRSVRRRQQLPKGVLRGCAECADCQKVRLIMLNCWSCFSGDVFCWLMHITSCRLLQGGIHLVHAGLFLRRLLFTIHLRRYLVNCHIISYSNMSVQGLVLHKLITWFHLVN